MAKVKQHVKNIIETQVTIMDEDFFKSTDVDLFPHEKFLGLMLLAKHGALLVETDPIVERTNPYWVRTVYSFLNPNHHD